MNLLLALIILPVASLADTAPEKTVTSVLVDHIRSTMAQYYPQETHQFHIEIRRLSPALEQISPNHVQGIRYNGIGIPSGFTLFDVILDNHQRNPQANIQAYVGITQWLPVPTHRIMSGESLSSQQFSMAWVDVTRQSGQFITDSHLFNGQVAGRNLREGVPVRQSELRRIPIVEAGDLVVVHYMRDGLSIALQGIARQDGAVGDRIRVHNEETRKTYTATIQPDGTLVWNQTL